MIVAFITNQASENLDFENQGNEDQEDNSVLLVLPEEEFLLTEELADIGIHQPTYDIRAGKKNYGVSVEFQGTHKLGRNLLALLPPHPSLHDVNSAAEIVEYAYGPVKTKLVHNLLNEKYHSLGDMKDDIHQMLIDASSARETYYFPLAGKVWNEALGLDINVSNEFLVVNEDNIQDAFEEHLGKDNMAAYYTDAGANKLLLADWGFEGFNGVLYGKVDAYLTEPMTEAEDQELRDWICGQNSDGLGESFEREDIPLEDEDFEGSLSVSFKGSGSEYFIKNQNEMYEYLGYTGQQMGGM